ncbi:autotransporter family protein [Methylophilus luteus]|uniref:Autotransporter outer membrane beta-barrel domain-containing protein n=1 Tax=Methylophilus luteus TaxID=640108 RepID=A0ABW3F915_9PROT
MALLYLSAEQAQAAVFTVESNQTVEDIVIKDGDTQLVNGKAKNTTVRGANGSTSSEQFVYGIADVTSVEDRGVQYVEPGGTAKETTVKADGKVSVFANGTIENLTVKSGGNAFIYAGSIWKGYIRFEPGSKDSGSPLTTTWKMTAGSALNTLNLLGTGHIDFEAPGGAFAAKTLSIENLVGKGGLITLNQVLDNGSVAGDKIVIRDGGTVTGTTNLAIRNHGGLGAKTTGNGLLVVEAQGSAVTTAQSSKDGFKLKQPVYAGAYEYRLRPGDANGNGQNWYLSSQLGSPSSGQLNGQTAYRPASAALPALMDLSGRMALHALLHGPQSVGSSMDTSTDPNAKHPLWLFASQERLHAGGDGSVNPSYSSWISGLHLGGDLWRNETSTTRLGAYGSVLYSQGDASGLLRSPSHSDAGNLSQTTYLGGLYLLSQLPNGVNLKTAVQLHQGKGSISSGDSATLKSNGAAASLQAGLPLPLNQHLTLEPQAQLIYQVQEFNDLHLAGNTKARLDSDNSVLSRLGARLAWEDKQATRPWVTEALFNIWHRSGGEQRVRFSTPAAQSRVEADFANTSLQVGLASRMTFKYGLSLAGSMSYQKAIEQSDLESVTAQVHLRWDM